MAKTGCSGSEYNAWEAPGQPVRICHSRSVLEEIRRAVVDGFLSFPRGGMEVGGVLFGFQEDNTVWISAARPLPCEHAEGPGFLLSPKDEAALSNLLQLPEREPRIAGLQPVGWYHSHTRSEVLLTDRDLDLYDRFFPEKWQVALVLRPENSVPTRAGFFIREADGSVRADSSYQEFAIHPSPRAQTTAQVVEAARPVEKKPAPVQSGQSEPVVTPPPTDPALPPFIPEPMKPAVPAPPPPPRSVVPPQAAQPDSAASPTTRPAAGQPSEQDRGGIRAGKMFPGQFETSFDLRPAAYRERDEEKSRGRSLNWVAAVLLLAAAGAGFWFYSQGALTLPALRNRAPISLAVADSSGKLLVSWDRNSAVVQHARSAGLEITDGSENVLLKLSSDQLQTGNVIYPRQSGKVDVKMRVEQPDGAVTEEVASFLATSAPQSEAIRPPGDPARTQPAEPNTSAPATDASAPAAQPPPDSPPAKPVTGAAPAGAASSTDSTSELSKLVRERELAQQERDEAVAEANQLRTTVGKQNARIRDLEQAIRALRNRLRYESSRR